ncbi:hypothetical protein [Flavobacterium sp.]|uniref:hypothetical protein n=1 Tax=Flavobacterium sp. TaxID=239 RepID=UPI00261D708D|nr:hypothetical protein [Flavobacterium sp.]
MKKLKILIIATLFVQIQMYSQTKTKITFGGNAAYHLGTSAQQKENSPFLFFKNGQSAGIDLTLIPKTGTIRYKLAIDYIIGTNDESAVTTYAKENNIEYVNYKFTKSNPNGFSIMASPQFMLFPKSKSKKLPLMWLDLKVGALFSNQQNVQYFLEQTTPNAEIKSNAVNFAYNPTVVINVIQAKKFFVNVKASYSNFGGFGIGLNITEMDCMGWPCFRCPATGCVP